MPGPGWWPALQLIGLRNRKVVIVPLQLDNVRKEQRCNQWLGALEDLNVFYVLGFRWFAPSRRACGNLNNGLFPVNLPELM